MSPEQIEGKELDGRSDIFSFGAALYEMVTGRRAFEGQSSLSVASAILEKEPAPITSVDSMVPPALEHAVQRCLAKDRDERWQSAHDLKAELEWIRSRPTAVPKQRDKNNKWMVWLGALILAGAAMFVAGYMSRPAPEDQSIRASLPPPPDSAFTLSSSIAGSMAISPDGQLLALTAQTKGNAPQLWVRSLDTLASRPLAGTEGAFAPFFRNTPREDLLLSTLPFIFGAAKQ
jgi:serine/threonine protein kinase